MRLEDLYENFGLVSQEQQLEMVISYRYQRAVDLDKPAKQPSKKRTTSKTSKAPTFTEKEKEVMKLLGLKQKDVLALRESLANDETEDETVLFQDDTFEDED